MHSPPCNKTTTIFAQRAMFENSGIQPATLLNHFQNIHSISLMKDKGGLLLSGNSGVHILGQMLCIGVLTFNACMSFILAHAM